MKRLLFQIRIEAESRAFELWLRRFLLRNAIVCVNFCQRKQRSQIKTESRADHLSSWRFPSNAAIGTMTGAPADPMVPTTPQ